MSCRCRHCQGMSGLVVRRGPRLGPAQAPLFESWFGILVYQCVGDLHIDWQLHWSLESPFRHYIAQNMLNIYPQPFDWAGLLVWPSWSPCCPCILESIKGTLWRLLSIPLLLFPPLKSWLGYMDERNPVKRVFPSPTQKRCRWHFRCQDSS